MLTTELIFLWNDHRFLLSKFSFSGGSVLVQYMKMEDVKKNKHSTVEQAKG